MAGIKISALPAATSAQLTDVFPADQSGPITRKIALSQVATLFNSNYVQLSPSGNQTITSNNLILQTGSFFATSGTYSSGSSSGGTAGSFKAYSPAAVSGSNNFLSANNSGNYSNILTNASTSAARTWTLPDATGTIALGGSTLPSIQGTANQVLVNGTSGSPVTGTAITLTTPQDIGTTSSVTFGQVNVDNLRLDVNTFSSTNTNGNINIVPNGTGVVNCSSLGTSGLDASFLGSNLVVASNSSPVATIASFINATGGAGSLFFSKSRGTTPGSYVAVHSGDDLGLINWFGDDGTSYTNAGFIQMKASGTISTGIVPSQLLIGTSNASGANVTAITISNAQAITLANALTVPNGGTGIATATAYGLIAGGTTSTGVFQSVATGTTGQLLSSNGSAALPSFTTATFPTTAGTSGTLMQSNGTNWVNTTATYPGTATGTGTILRANGTNWIASTSTFADTYTASNLLYSNGANTVAGLATANNSILVTNGSGVPSIGTSVGADLTINTIIVGLGGGSVATNTCVGKSAMVATASGAGNSAFGNVALNAVTSGAQNTAIGNSTLNVLTTTSENTAVGAGSLLSVTGSSNTAIGRSSGLNSASGATTLTSGSTNTLIGYRAGVNSATASGTLALGASAVSDIATGATSSDNGPGIAIGSAASPVGFRGDASIYPTSGVGGGTLALTFSGFWRVKINGTYYRIPIYPDS